VGAWLTAAALERTFARPYAALLARAVLEPSGVATPCDGTRGSTSAEPICPANGGSLSLTLEQWLQFLRLACVALAGCGDVGARAGAIAAPITPLPGWAPLERGVRLGWKHCGGGWFGHQSVWPRSSAFVRVNASCDTQLAVFSRDHPSAMVAARVFGDVLPELFDWRPPRPAQAAAACDRGIDGGGYASARFDARVATGGDGLELRVHDRLRAVTERAQLAPAAAGLFFARSSTIESFQYAQLVSACGGEFLWNGRFVLRRL
jgi:hypothetical protein